jgi:hypothetical protein
MSSQFVSCNYSGLLELLFKRDLGQNTVDLNLHQLRDNKDLFYFFFDLVTKGIVYLYGTGNTVTLDDISSEQFDYVIQRLMYAGIKVNKAIRPNESNHATTVIFKEPVSANDKLEAFSADIIMSHAIISISFEIVRV